jgi:hypothetical protein
MEKENKRLKEELPKQKAAIQRKYQQALEYERGTSARSKSWIPHVILYPRKMRC